MQVFNVKVSTRGNVRTEPKTYHVPAHHQEDFVYTIHPDNEKKYDLEAIKIKGAAFTKQKINSKTILMHDDNSRYHEKGDTKYKYEVFVKPVEGGKLLKEDPTIVNQ